MIGLFAERAEINKDSSARGGITKQNEVIRVLNPHISKNTKYNLLDFNIRYTRKWKDA